MVLSMKMHPEPRTEAQVYFDKERTFFFDIHKAINEILCPVLEQAEPIIELTEVVDDEPIFEITLDEHYAYTA